VLLDDAKAVAEWIEDGIAKFTKELGEPYSDVWKPDDADPSKTSYGLALSSTPTQSSHPPQ
jgi:hypothetical protein